MAHRWQHGVYVHVDTWCVRSSGERSCRRGGLDGGGGGGQAEETAVEATEEEVRAAEVRAAEAMEEVVTRRRWGWSW